MVAVVVLEGYLPGELHSWIFHLPRIISKR